MRRGIPDRQVHFAVEDNCLLRIVEGSNGRTYTHRCERKVYETVAHALAETPPQGDGTTLALIARSERLPFTQVNLALEFLKDRGIAEVRHRRCYPGTKELYLDAMVEFYALAEVPPGSHERSLS